MKQQEFTEELAEFLGVVLGDGNIYHKDSCCQLRIVGNKIKDKEYFIQRILPLIEKLFEIKAKLREGKNNCIIAYVYNKSMIQKLENFGLQPGNKLKNQVRIPEWIFNERKYIIACVRGLIDTDGCVFKKYAGPGRPQIEFYSRIKSLQADFERAMRVVGVEGKWRRPKGRRADVFGIYKNSEVAKYKNIVGFHNNKHLKHFENERIVPRAVTTASAH